MGLSSIYGIEYGGLCLLLASFTSFSPETEYRYLRGKCSSIHTTCPFARRNPCVSWTGGGREKGSLSRQCLTGRQSYLGQALVPRICLHFVHFLNLPPFFMRNFNFSNQLLSLQTGEYLESDSDSESIDWCPTLLRSWYKSYRCWWLVAG